MFTRRLTAILIVLFSTVGGNVAGADQSPRLGKPVNVDELAALPRHVFADGTGLPAGTGDTIRGTEIFAAECASCHGNKGQGGSAIELVGDRSLLATEYPDRGIGVYWPYAPTLFEYIRRAMPPVKPYSLTPDDVYAVIAKLLELSELVEPGQQVDAEFLSAFQMPNRDGFVSNYD